MIYRTLHRNLKTEQHEAAKRGGELVCPETISSSWSTSGVHRATLVSNPVNE